MADTKKLELRKAIKQKKSKYKRVNSHKVNEIKKSGWRKPKGCHCKTGKNHKSKPPMIEVGYGSPSEVKGLLADGTRPVLVVNTESLNSIDKSLEGVIISSTVGKRKKLEIIKKAMELKIKIINVKNPDEYVKSYLELRKEMQNSKSKMKASRDKKSQERSKKKEENIEKKIEKSEEDIKKDAKKKKDDVLTTKQKD